jgi:phosphoglycolate phosphatase-like HAD superfamily hydrolase
MNMKTKAALFDFDGTLADSIGDHYSAVCAVFKAVSVVPPDRKVFWSNLRPPFASCYRAFGCTLDEESIWKIYNANIDRKRARLFDDALSTVEDLSKKMPVYVVSAGPVDEIKIACNHSGLSEHLREVHGGHELKSEAIADIMCQLETRPNELVYVSDFAPEVTELNSAFDGMLRILGVTTGISDENELLSSGAERCFPNLRGLKEYLLG